MGINNRLMRPLVSAAASIARTAGNLYWQVEAFWHSWNWRD